LKINPKEVTPVRKYPKERSFFLPIHLQPVYKSYFENEKHPIAEYFFERGLLLPSYYDLLKSEVWKICRIINQLAI